MSDWSEGYVTEIEYTVGFYSELAPQLLRFALLSQGVGAPQGPLSYLEIGCGNGLTANIVAAANPDVDVTGVDFNPAHVRQARALAEAAGTRNVRFLERSFQDLAGDDTLPGFDVIALHGVYSWVSAANRGHICEIIRKNLKPGGIVYISYNAYPGWSAGATLQRLLRDGGALGGGSVVQQLQRGLGLAGRLRELNASFFTANPEAGRVLDVLGNLSANYLAHEYLNRDWNAFYFSDIARELGEAKVVFGASANLAQHADLLNFTDDQRKLLASIPDVTVRELVRDTLLNTSFRRDIFVRGAGVPARSVQRELWNAQRFVLLQDPADVPRKITAQVGEVTLNADVYEPVLATLARGPQTLGELMRDEAVSRLAWEQAAEALLFLVILGVVQIALPADGEAERAVRTKAINAAIVARIRAGENIHAFASPVTGSGISVDGLSQLFLAAHWTGEADKVGYVLAQLKEKGQVLRKDGSAVEGDEAARAHLQEALGAFEDKTIRLLQRVGVV